MSDDRNPHGAGHDLAAHSGTAIAAEDPRPRREVWEQRLLAQRWILEWPAVLRERILEAIVEDERAMVDAELNDLEPEAVSTFAREWRWEPENGRLYSTVAAPQSSPDLDAYLEEAHNRIRPRRIEASVAMSWLADITVGEQYPDRLRRIAYGLWQLYRDPSPYPAAPTHPGGTDPFTDKVRTLAQKSYEPGASQPHAPVALSMPDPAWFQSVVRLAFPDEVIALASEPTAETEAEVPAPHAQKGPVR